MLGSLSLLLLLSGCASTPNKSAPLPPVPIPASLLVECYGPTIPSTMTYGDSLILNEQLLNALERCNHQVRGVRRLEAYRSSP
ncbi:Rz1-like lysis system protein LysC [Pseudomonas farris]|uniref:Rz1-like lysis system protein LysC n=1 Tax=Pseudomonas farris TaxID=2841207 RepID=UPI003F59C62F